MYARFQQPFAEGQISQEDYRNIRLLTVLSKLVMALVLGTVAMLASFGWVLFT